MPSIAFNLPHQAAVDQVSRKTLVPTTLTSREMDQLAAEIKLRSMISARVEDARILQEMKARLEQRVSLEKTQLADGTQGAGMDRSRFIEEMRSELTKSGYKRGDAKRGSLRDLKSVRRLGLVWDMNLAQALGYARWKSDMNPDSLANEPAYELIRVKSRREIRDWPLVWEEHGGTFHGAPGKDYPRGKGRMIALKTDPIWRRISRFGTPWPPFDWGSGMGLRGIGRGEAEALRVIAPGAVLTPLAVPFNADFKTSLKGIPQSAREGLRSSMGDSIRIDGDSLSIQRNTSPETDEQRLQSIDASLRERARAQYLQARDLYAGELRRAQAGTEEDRGVAGETDPASIFLAQASAVAVGRKQVFHDTMPEAHAEAFFASTAGWPPQVAADYDGETGDLLVWRRDLVDIDPAEVNAAMRDGRGGMLLGYGLDSPAWVNPVPHVRVRIYSTPRTAGDDPVTGFDAPLDGWRVYAEARARDISDAWAIATETEWEVMP